MYVCSPVPELPFPSKGDHLQTATIVAYPEPPPALLAAREALLRVFHAVAPPVPPALCGGASWWDAVLAANRALLLQLLPLLPEGASVVIICVGPLCAPLPALLRRAGVRSPIAFIAGAPFTCAESYRELPAAPRRGWLEGVLCADACCKSHAPHRTRPKTRATLIHYYSPNSFTRPGARAAACARVHRGAALHCVARFVRAPGRRVAKAVHSAARPRRERVGGHAAARGRGQHTRG